MSRPAPRPAEAVMEEPDATVLDLVDNLLTKGVVLTGEVTFGLAGIDLIHVRLDAVLCAVDRLGTGGR